MNQASASIPSRFVSELMSATVNPKLREALANLRIPVAVSPMFRMPTYLRSFDEMKKAVHM